MSDDESEDGSLPILIESYHNDGELAYQMYLVDGGQTVKVMARENPSTGYHWIANFEDDEMEAASLVSSEFEQDDAPEGFVGVPGLRTFTFKVAEEAEKNAQFTLLFYILMPG